MPRNGRQPVVRLRAGRPGTAVPSFGRPVPSAHCPSAFLRFRSSYLTIWLSLKIGRIMLIAMKPTMPPISTIISGSIIAVTLLMTLLSSRL